MALAAMTPSTDAEGVRLQCNVSAQASDYDAIIDAQAAVVPQAAAEEPAAPALVPPAESALPPEAQPNFALVKDGAKVIAHNPGAKRVAALLDDDSDTFMRNDCRDDKWLVLELSQVARVSRVEVAQHELYSARVRHFEVRGRQSHPRTDGVDAAKGINGSAWRALGAFTAEKAKGTQSFPVDHPSWVRYLLVRFLTHYGTEPVCAINGLAVYGRSAAEELEDQLAAEEEAAFVVPSPAAEGPALAVAVPQSEGPAAAAAPADPAAAAPAAREPAATSGAVQSESKAAASGTASAGAQAGSAAGPAPLDAPLSSSSNSTEAERGAEEAAATPAALPAGGVPPLDAAQPQAGINAVGAAPDAPVERDSNRAGAAPGAAVNGQPTPASGDASRQPAASPPAAAPAANGADLFEELPVPKAKAGSGVYELLVQEIRAARAQQRLTAKALEALQRNLTALAASASAVRERYELSDEALARRVDAVAGAHLRRAAHEMASLRAAAAAAAKREHAALSLLAALAAALVVNTPRFAGSGRWPLMRRCVVVLAAANAAVGALLHWRGAAAAVAVPPQMPLLPP